LRRAPHLQLQHHLLQRTLPFPDGRFQTIVCNEVIEHLGLQTATSLLAETRRVLKLGGKLILFSPNAYNRREALADPTHLYCFRPSELRRLLLASGFQSIVPLNTGRPLLGSGVAAARLGNVAFRLTHFDWLSASSNFVAEA
jgi:SAM-dependent methyltransferase